MTNVVSWSVHEKWVDTLFRAYATDVAQTTKKVVACDNYVLEGPA